MSDPQRIQSQVRLPVTPEMDRATLVRQYHELQDELLVMREKYAYLSERFDGAQRRIKELREENETLMLEYHILEHQETMESGE